MHSAAQKAIDDQTVRCEMTGDRPEVSRSSEPTMPTTEPTIEEILADWNCPDDLSYLVCKLLLARVQALEGVLDEHRELIVAMGMGKESNPCPVSYPHAPHDYCDGNPGAYKIGTRPPVPTDADKIALAKAWGNVNGKEPYHGSAGLWGWTANDVAVSNKLGFKLYEALPYIDPKYQGNKIGGVFPYKGYATSDAAYLALHDALAACGELPPKEVLSVNLNKPPATEAMEAHAASLSVPKMVTWVEDGETKTAPEVDATKFGPHNYPNEGGTSDCTFGCGCWTGRCRSGGPVYPFGACPKNPLPPPPPERRPTEDEIVAAMDEQLKGSKAPDEVRQGYASGFCNGVEFVLAWFKGK